MHRYVVYIAVDREARTRSRNSYKVSYRYFITSTTLGRPRTEKNRNSCESTSSLRSKFSTAVRAAKFAPFLQLSSSFIIREPPKCTRHGVLVPNGPILQVYIIGNSDKVNELPHFTRNKKYEGLSKISQSSRCL